MMNDIEIRRLTLQNLDDITSIHLAAFPGRALSELGPEAVRRYYHWLLTGPHPNSVTVGVFEYDILTGFVFSGPFSGALSGFLRNNRIFLVWRFISRPHLFFSSFVRDRVVYALRILLRKPQSMSVLPESTSSFGILSLAVHPRWQGLGLGRALMLYSEQVAVKRGYTRLHLTVDIENVPAIHLYEKLGWVKHTPDGLWRGVMLKQLEKPA